MSYGKGPQYREISARSVPPEREQDYSRAITGRSRVYPELHKNLVKVKSLRRPVDCVYKENVNEPISPNQGAIAREIQ
jgi:hypothetical protein